MFRTRFELSYLMTLCFRHARFASTQLDFRANLFCLFFGLEMFAMKKKKLCVKQKKTTSEQIKFHADEFDISNIFPTVENIMMIIAGI